MEGTVVNMRELEAKMKAQDDYLQQKFAEATSPEKKMRKLQQQIEGRANEPNSYISPFSPAQRAMLDTVSSGGSNVLMDVGRTLTTSPFNLTRQQLPS